MKLSFKTELANGYNSASQISRVLTENWVAVNSYCPSCGAKRLCKYPDNKPVADFYCDMCKEDFELKSKSGKLSNTIVDGAYDSMIDRITSIQNPNFFILTYDKEKGTVNNFILIPKYFFIPQIINKRRPLASTARRSGWVGCNIDLKQVPELGKIYLVRNSIVIQKRDVLTQWQQSVFLRNTTLDVRGWTLDVLRCVDLIPSRVFSLNEIYSFEERLKKLHPDNNFIKDKIRQQLQYLRDKGIIEFTSKGNYRKL